MTQATSSEVIVKIEWPRLWLSRTVPVVIIGVPMVNALVDDMISPFVTGPVQQIESVSGPDAVPFAPLGVFDDHYYDVTGQSAQSYDITLYDPISNSDSVNVPSPCPATVTSINAFGSGYGNHLDSFQQLKKLDKT